MFFLSVRPFERAYRQAEQQGGGGGGGGQQEETALSEMQRQVISATFNLIRQEDSYGPGEFSENVVSVSLAQARLKEQVGTLLQRMQNLGLTQTDPGFRDVSAILPKAVEAMAKAEEDLAAQELRDALPDEQTALRFLQQAEETYERYVQQEQNQQGGGGGAGQQAAEDLADLFELELDKLKNQYETVRRGQQQESDSEVDELIEQLKELARRQEQEAERQRRRAQAQQGSAGGFLEGCCSSVSLSFHSNLKAVPVPSGAGSNHMRPSWHSMIRLTMASPMPLPSNSSRGFRV